MKAWKDVYYNDGEQSGSFNINTGVRRGCVLFSIFLADFISLAAVDQAKGYRVDIIYRTDGELFNMRRLKTKTKVKATSIVDLQYADDCYCCPHGGRPTEHPWCFFQKEASEQQPRYWSTRLLFSPPSYMAVRHGSPTVAMLKCSNSSNSAYSRAILDVHWQDRITNARKCRHY